MHMLKWPCKNILLCMFSVQFVFVCLFGGGHTFLHAHHKKHELTFSSDCHREGGRGGRERGGERERERDI